MKPLSSILFEVDPGGRSYQGRHGAKGSAALRGMVYVTSLFFTGNLAAIA